MSNPSNGMSPPKAVSGSSRLGMLQKLKNKLSFLSGANGKQGRVALQVNPLGMGGGPSFSDPPPPLALIIFSIDGMMHLNRTKISTDLAEPVSDVFSICGWELGMEDSGFDFLVVEKPREEQIKGYFTNKGIPYQPFDIGWESLDKNLARVGIKRCIQNSIIEGQKLSNFITHLQGVVDGGIQNRGSWNHLRDQLARAMEQFEEIRAKAQRVREEEQLKEMRAKLEQLKQDIDTRDPIL